MFSPKETPAQRSKVEPEIREGSSSPLGATVSPDGVNFSIFSKDATAIETAQLKTKNYLQSHRDILKR
jgi:pullulanase/glycogen debranching enzyme